MKIAFVDHSYHKVSGSTAFIRDIFRRNGHEIDDYDDNSWRGGKRPEVSGLMGYDNIFYCQLIHPPEDLRRLEGRNIVWFPMENAFDGQIGPELLSRLSEIKMRVVFFSRAGFDIFRRAGFDCFYLQFFFNPDSLPRKEGYNDPPKVFFWQRIDEIDIHRVRKVIGANQITGLDWYFAPDPEMAGHHSGNLALSSQTYLGRVADADIFFAPRRYEGIGMSFLEAMAMGLCVVAADTPTMNEYIVHGHNGLLYNRANPREIDLSGFRAMGQTAKDEARAGHETTQRSFAEMAMWAIPKREGEKC